MSAKKGDRNPQHLIKLPITFFFKNFLIYKNPRKNGRFNLFYNNAFTDFLNSLFWQNLNQLILIILQFYSLFDLKRKKCKI